MGWNHVPRHDLDHAVFVTTMGVENGRFHRLSIRAAYRRCASWTRKLFLERVPYGSVVRNCIESNLRNNRRWRHGMEQKLERFLRPELDAFACWPYRLFRLIDVDRPMVETIGYPSKKSIQRLGDRLERCDGSFGARLVLLSCPMVFYSSGRHVLLSTDVVAMVGLQRKPKSRVSQRSMASKRPTLSKEHSLFQAPQNQIRI